MEPLWATARSDRPTLGGDVARLAEFLGIPLMPWQRQVVDVICEQNPDGGWRYRKVVFSTPRQCGKSTLVAVLMLHRILTVRDQRCWYTSSTGIAARDQFMEVLKRAAPLGDRVKTRLGAGDQEIRYPATDGFLRLFPPTPESLHGRQGDLVVLDETWSFTVEQGGALLQAVVPTMATRGGRAQLVITSTAGDVNSLWYRRQIDEGRAAVSDPDARVAYFEWGAGKTDPFDETLWRDWHPALGHTITEDSMRDALATMGPVEFRRAYANAWPDVQFDFREQWPACVTGAKISEGAPLVFAFDAPPDHGKAVIVVAGRDGDGRTRVETVDARKGLDWVQERCAELAAKHGGQILVSSDSPAHHLAAEMVLAGLPIKTVTRSEFADCVGRFQTGITEGMVSHRGEQMLDDAIRNIVVAESGERPTYYRKGNPGIDISPVVAAALAVGTAMIDPGDQVF